MKNNGLKNAKAITLIAMVVTIIVLLILAGVSIAVLTGENGIINRASSAKTTNEEAEIMENIRLAYNNAQIGKYAGKNENFANIMKSDLEKVYGTGDNNVKVDDNGDNTYTVTIRGRKYNVAANGNVTRKNGVTIGERTTKLKQGESAQVTASVDFGIPGTISWKSSDSTKVSVTGSGTSATITAVAASGSAEITAYIAGTEHEDKFTVNIAQAITGINASPLSIGTGETVAIEITTTPNTGVLEDITYSFVSNNTAVATVDSTTGEVTGVTQGNTTITITPSNGLAAITCNVEVTKTTGKFQTVNGKAYYYTGSNPTAGTEITAANMGQFLGMKVDYTPYSKFSDRGTSSTYRLFYVDVNNKYGDGNGTIYIISDATGSYATLDNMNIAEKNGENMMAEFNPMWSEAFSTSSKDNVAYSKNLLDKGIWKRYTDTGSISTSKIARYAVGAPGLEMWIDAYNAFIDINQITGSHRCNCTVTRVSNGKPNGENKGLGYYVGLDGDYPWSDGYSFNVNSLPRKTDFTDLDIADRFSCYDPYSAMLIASPAASYETAIFRLYDGRIVTVGGGTNSSFSPMVCCKTGVAITEAQ